MEVVLRELRSARMNNQRLREFKKQWQNFQHDLRKQKEDLNRAIQRNANRQLSVNFILVSSNNC